MPLSAAISNVDAAGAENDRFPEPSVFRTSFALPSADGITNVVMPDRESGDFRVIKLVPLSVPSTRFTPLPTVEEFTDQYRPEPTN